MGAEEALMYVGGFGVWQVTHYVLLCTFFAFPTMWQLFAIVFEGFTFHPHWCKPPPDANVSHPQLYAPMEENPLAGMVTPKACELYKYNCSYKPNETTSCRYGYQVDPVYFEPDVGTITMEWSLFCDKRDLVEVSQIIFTIGFVVGSLVFSPFNDTIGRKKVFFFCQLIMCLFGIVMAFSHSYVVFCCGQFLTGAFTMGNDVAGFVLANEMFPADLRTYMAPAIYFFVAAGMMCMIIFAYYLREWRSLQLAVSLAPLLTMCYVWHCPESVRWLIVNGRYDEAKKILDEAAACNGVEPIPMEIIMEEELEEAEQGDKKPSLLYYMSQKKTLMFFLVMCYLVFACNLMYFGLNLMAQALPADLYLTFFILSALEIPGTVAAIFSMYFFGRRLPLAFFNLFAGVFLIIGGICNVLPVEDFFASEAQKGVVVTAVTLTAKFGVAGAWCTELVYAQEIFPTNLRASGVGIVNAAGVIGGVLAPLGNLLARNVSIAVPVFVFGVLAVIAGILSLLEPETMGRPLPTTVEEILHWSLSLSKKDREEAKVRKQHLNEKRKMLRDMAKGRVPKPPTAATAYENKAFSNGEYSKNMPPPIYDEKRSPVQMDGAHDNPAYHSEPDITRI